MSTTIEVYPAIHGIPSFDELAATATVRLHEFLDRAGLRARPALAFELSKCDHLPLELCGSSPLRWDDDAYAWFYVDGIAGGTDTYFCAMDEVTREGWEELITADARAGAWAHEIRTAFDIGHYWYFRRTAGQPAIIHVAYGLLAAALAELTRGFVYSGDSAWDYERFPCDATTFYKYYFRPEHAIAPSKAAWAAACLDSLGEELAGYPQVR